MQHAQASAQHAQRRWTPTGRYCNRPAGIVGAWTPDRHRDQTPTAALPLCRCPCNPVKYAHADFDVALCVVPRQRVAEPLGQRNELM